MALTSLIVCADEEAVEILSSILHELGIEPQHSGDRKLSAVRLTAESFDVIIFDCTEEALMLPVITSTRRAKANKNAQLIALATGENNVREIFAAGSDFVLYKPISRETAGDSIRAARGRMRKEKRKAKRVRLSSKAELAYSNVENVPATLLDLSEDGVQIQSEKKLPPRCKVYFQFTLPGQVSTVRLSGEVVWQDAQGRVGLRFASVPQSSRQVLNAWFASTVVLEKFGKQNTPDDITITIKQPIASQMGGLGLLSVSASDRRVITRHACQIGAEVYRLGTSIPNRCRLSDISTGGCYVETTNPFPAGTPLEIVVHTREMKLRIQGRVQTVHPAFGMGVEFLLRTAQHKAQVKELISCAAHAGLTTS